jgi:hypothetical protein
MIDAAADAFSWLCQPVPVAEFLDLLHQTGFSAAAYRDAYGDLAERNWDDLQALSHLFNHGLDERRIAPITLNRRALVSLARLPMHDGAFRAKLLTFLGWHLFDHTVERPDAAAIRECWPTIQELVHHGARPYFVAGDSHSHQYALTGTRGDAWMLPIHLLCTGGSAGGLGNPASRSGFGHLLRQAVQAIEILPETQQLPFLLQFGQVDLEFVYHYRRVRGGRQQLDLNDYRAFCDTILAQYVRFVTELFAGFDRSRVFILSVFPPALSDAAWHQGYFNVDIANKEAMASVDQLRAGIRAIEIADLHQRTEIHGYFSNNLRTECRRLGFGYLDSFTPFLGADGVVDANFVIPETGGAEHHLDSRRTYETIRELIWHCIYVAEQSHL